MKVTSLRPQYVEFIPKELDSDVLYISNRFQTVSHLCCCGCGTKIVTPLRGLEYTLTTSGDRVSLSPSIGNWSHPCQSHYWIKDSAVIEAAPMSKADILAGRAYDDELRADYFARVMRPIVAPSANNSPARPRRRGAWPFNRNGDPLPYSM